MKFRYFFPIFALAPSVSIAKIVPVAVVEPIQAPATKNAILRVGTEVPLRLSEALTTKQKNLHVGQRFRMETSEAIMVQGVNVVPIGTPAIGEITDVTNKGMWGKSGHFTAQIRYLTLNGRQIRLSGTFDDKGSAGGVAAVAVSAIVFAPAGFFMTGTSAQLPVGTPVKAFIDEDVALSFAAQSVAPLKVPVTAPTAVPAALSAPAAAVPSAQH